MKKFLFTGIFLVCAVAILAQKVVIKDRETGDPLNLVTLMSSDRKVSAVTNSNGQADISPFKNTMQIQIRLLGYESVSTSYEEIQQNGFLIQMEISNLSLDEVVKSATRWRQSTDDVPSKIISISAKKVALQNPQTAADLLGVSGSVFVQKSQQGGGSPMIRGFATNRLIYAVDGVRMNTAIFRSGNIQNVINLDPFAMESTEVLFGPGSVIYGSDAIGGVMSFHTLSPQLSLDDKIFITGKALARYSSANSEKTGHFDVNIGWKKWAIVTSFSSWDYGNLRQGSNGPDDYIKDYYVQRFDSLDLVVNQEDELKQIPTAYSQLNLMQKVRFNPNKNWDIHYGFHYSETSNYGRYDRHNRVRNGTARYAEWYYGPQTWLMNNLEINHTSDGQLFDDMTVRLAQQSFNESRISRNLNSEIREIRKEHVDAYSANIDFTKNLNSKHILFYGMEYVLNNVSSDGKDENIISGVFTDGPDRYPQASWQSAAIYLNDEIVVNEKMVIQAGMRYNHFLLNADFSDNAVFYPFPFEKAMVNDGALTGSIGSVYRPSKSWAINMNLGTAFRSPNVDDMGKIFDSEPGSVVVPNPDLEAEYAYNLDVGVARVFGDWMKLDMTTYYTILQNAMVRRDFQLNGLDSILYDGEMSRVQAIQNAAVARVYGLQTGLEVKLPAGFNFSSEINIQRGEEELDDGSTSPSRHAAPWFGMSRLTYHAQKLDIKLYTVYQGKKEHEDLPVGEQDKDEIYALDENGETYAPSWYTLNLKAMYALSKNMSLSAGIENITDQRYRPYSSGISGAGRNFILSLKLQF